MEASSSNLASRPSGIEVLAGAALFILWGFVLVGGNIPHEWQIASFLFSALMPIFFIGLLLTPVAFILAWTADFPRWSYPYTVHLLVFSLYLTAVATPGLAIFGLELFGREVWGWRAWIPLTLIVLVAYGITRSTRPAGCFFSNCRQDWTLPLFGLSGLLPLLVLISFGEVDRLYSLVFMIFLTALMTGTAVLYMLSRSTVQRAFIMLVGISAVIATALLAPNFYWQMTP